MEVVEQVAVLDAQMVVIKVLVGQAHLVAVLFVPLLAMVAQDAMQLVVEVVVQDVVVAVEATAQEAA